MSESLASWLFGCRSRSRKMVQQWLFQPMPNITAHELALVVANLAQFGDGATLRVVVGSVADGEFRKSPIFRHFVEIGNPYAY